MRAYRRCVKCHLIVGCVHTDFSLLNCEYCGNDELGDMCPKNRETPLNEIPAICHKCFLREIIEQEE